MRTVLQRVANASVHVGGTCVGAIDRGVLLLVGIGRGDTEEDADRTVKKIARLRCFPGRTPMDLTLGDVGGGCLVVSQFTLHATLKAGNRPGFADAEAPEVAERLYERVAAGLAAEGLEVARGVFGAHMEIRLTADGPVTLLIETQDGRLLR